MFIFLFKKGIVAQSIFFTLCAKAQETTSFKADLKTSLIRYIAIPNNNIIPRQKVSEGKKADAGSRVCWQVSVGIHQAGQQAVSSHQLLHQTSRLSSTVKTDCQTVGVPHGAVCGATLL